MKKSIEYCLEYDQYYVFEEDRAAYEALVGKLSFEPEYGRYVFSAKQLAQLETMEFPADEPQAAPVLNMSVKLLFDGETELGATTWYEGGATVVCAILPKCADHWMINQYIIRSLKDNSLAEYFDSTWFPVAAAATMEEAVNLVVAKANSIDANRSDEYAQVVTGHWLSIEKNLQWVLAEDFTEAVHQEKMFRSFLEPN